MAISLSSIGDELQDAVGGLIEDAKSFVSNKPLLVAGGTAVVGAGAGALVVKAVKKRKAAKKKVAKKKTTTRKKPAKKKTTKRKQKKPYTAGKRKDTSTRRIRFTKNNQPYVILKSGKARFIKKSSVSRSRKRKGGRY